MRTIKYAAFGLVVSIATVSIGACSASGSGDGPPDDGVRDGATIDAGTFDDVRADVRTDAERPLVCGDAGFCETRLPTSDLGLPLSLQSVWVVASGDVWSVTAEGFVLHFDGTAWNVEYRANHTLASVWATKSSVWVGGESGLLLHRTADGTWTRVETERVAVIRSIAGRSDDDVWFASLADSVDHFDGSTLSRYLIGISGIRITTVFGHPGQGMYVAGYVSGTPEEAPTGPLQHLQPYVLELSPSGPTLFSALLPEQRGFVPLAADVTASPGEDPTLFVAGFNYLDGHTRYKSGAFGRTTPIELREWHRPGPYQQPVYGYLDIDPDMPPTLGSFWIRRWNDVLFVDSERDYASYLLRWDGVVQSGSSLAMGGTVPPRRVFGVHGNATEAWIVGDGFAFKGATP